MLTREIRVLKAKAKPKKININISSATYNNGVITVVSKNHCLHKNEKIFLSRKLQNDEEFLATFSVSEVVDKNTFTFFYLLDNYKLIPSTFEISEMMLEPMTYKQRYLVLNFNDKNKHICCNNRFGDIMRSVYPQDYTFDEPDEICKDTYNILYNNISYYKSNKIDYYGERVLETMLNIKDHYISMYFNGSVITRRQCFVPIDYDLTSVYDDRTRMFITLDGTMSTITDNFNKIIFICNDCRFFDVGNKFEIINGQNIELHDDVEFYSYSMTLNTSIGLSENVSYNLTHEEKVNNYISDEKTNNINRIIDYEKQMFSPVSITENRKIEDNDILNDDFIDISKIRFNVFLRDRVYDEETGDWTAPDKSYWASLSCSPPRNELKFKKGFENNEGKGDLLGQIGFDDNDVYNQNKRLNKTFLRLSFYDTMNRDTQSLLFYSTIFINTPKQYAKYMLNISSKSTIIGDGYTTTPNINDELALCSNFECYSKFNMSGSSEGFYLYLFSDITTGAELTPIYMKVELNHAKYGKVIPLIHPVDEYNKEILPPIHYQKKINVGSDKVLQYTDLNQLYKDMYIKIYVKYDYNNNRYVWLLPYKNDGEIVFNLYEPRIIDINE